MADMNRLKTLIGAMGITALDRNAAAVVRLVRNIAHVASQ